MGYLNVHMYVLLTSVTVERYVREVESLYTGMLTTSTLINGFMTVAKKVMLSLSMSLK